MVKSPGRCVRVALCGSSTVWLTPPADLIGQSDTALRLLENGSGGNFWTATFSPNRNETYLSQLIFSHEKAHLEKLMFEEIFTFVKQILYSVCLDSTIFSLNIQLQGYTTTVHLFIRRPAIACPPVSDRPPLTPPVSRPPIGPAATQAPPRPITARLSRLSLG